MEARGKTVEQWFSMVSQGQILLPRFQRHEAWRPNQIIGLLENVLRKPSLPIGALLVLEVGDKELFHSRPIVGAPLVNSKPSMHLLDGQQRMTALWRALTANYEDIAIFVSLKPRSPSELDDGEVASDEPEIEVEKRWMHKGVMRPVWANDDHEILKRELLPIQCLCPGQAGEKRLTDFQARVREGGADPSAFLGRIYELRMRVSSYVVPFLSLPVGTGRETALDVFIKMNTSASPLSDYDIVVAQLEEATGESLHDKVRELKEFEPGLAAYGDAEDNVLAIAALLVGKPPLKKTYLEKEFGEQLASVWPRLRTGVKRGVEFLRDEGIFGEKTLPTEIAFYLVCALWADVPVHGYDDEGNARSIIRKALWRACFTNRYLKTATTRAYADFKQLSLMVMGKTGDASPELFDEATYPLPEAGELTTAGWPTKKDRLPKALLALTLRAGGYDFADGAKANANNVGQREYHHVFPVASFPDGTPDSTIYRALNCALITWRTNRKLSANTPLKYIEERTKASNLGVSEMRDRLASHLIAYKDMLGSYDDFLNERAKYALDHIAALCEGRRPSLEKIKHD